MRFIFYLLSSIWLLSAQAQIEFVPAQQILMTAKSCEELNAHTHSILEWAKKLGSTASEIPECYCSKTSCQIDVAPISPYIVREWTTYGSGSYANATHHGPNCFNAALATTQTLPNITYTRPDEMTAILNSSLCREKKINEPLLPGDILVVRDQSKPYLEVHAGVYLNASLSFSKYGQVSFMPFSYGMNVDRAYGVLNEKCRRVEGLPSRNHECYGQPFVNYFSCTSLSKFISQVLRQPKGLDKNVQDVYARTSSLDNGISNVAFAGRKVEYEKLKTWQSEIQSLIKQAEILERNTDLDDKNRELSRLSRFRLLSLYDQTRIIARALGWNDLDQPGLQD